MVDNVFIPKEITIKVGDTIKWTNDGTLAHDVRSDDGTTFNSETEFPGPEWIKPGEEFEFTFTAEGVIPYYCLLHAVPGGTTGMVGTITVAP
jgi:plastocyanin